MNKDEDNMICNECETVAHCTKHGCVPKQPAPVSKDEALKLALEAIESEGWCDTEIVITAIKQALAQPVLWLVNGVVQVSNIPADYTGCLYTTSPAQPAPVQEPFCFVYVENGEEYFAPKGAYVPDNAQPLYTTPPAQEFVCSTGLCHYKTAAQRTWVGLTDDEVTICHSLAVLSKKHNGTDPSFTTLLHQQIEAKLKAVNGFHSTEKNT